MRFLFINQYYSPDFAATAQQLSDLCESLAQDGHEVHVLTSRSLYDGRDIELPKYEVLNGVHVHRINLTNGKRDRLRQRFMGYISFYLKAFLKIHMIPRCDVVVTLTTPPLISLLGTWLRVFRKTRFIYWVMDIYPDIAVKAGVLSKIGPAKVIWSTLGRLSYLTANRVVVLGHDMKAVIEGKGVKSSKINVIQSWASSEEIYPIERDDNAFAKAHFDESRFTIMYSGNMGTCHSFKEVVEGIDSLKEEDHVDFAFVGGGRQKDFIQRSLEKNDHVQFLPYQDRKVLAQSLSAPDAHLITLQKKYDGLLVPSKLYGIMASAKPVLFVGSDDCEVGRIIKDSGCGLIVEPGNAEAFSNAVRELSRNRSLATEMGEKGRTYFLRHFDQVISVRKFSLMLEKEGLLPGIRGVRQLAHSTLNYATSSGGAQRPARETS